MEQAQEVLLGLLRAALWPGLVSLAIVLLAGIVLSGRAPGAWPIVLSFVASYFVGHALAAGSDWTLRPARNWQWMFYLVPLAGLAGVISTSRRATWINRCVLIALLGVLTAGLLTAKPVLWAPRPLCILLVFAYFISLWAALKPLESRVSAESLAAAFALPAAGLSLMISEQISLSDGKIVVSAAAAFGGVALGTWIAKRYEAAAGLSVPYVIALGGWSWIEVLSEARLWPMVIIPLAPLALWLTQRGKLTRLRGAAALSFHVAVMIAVIGVAALLLGMGAESQFE
jgi:hypothetical protein